MGQGFFITGTDTGIGKTWVTAALMRHLQGQGKCVAAMKPVAAGCRWQGVGWRNEDALLLQQGASLPLPYETVNPYAFELPVSPHIAAARAGIPIRFEVIVARLAELLRLAEVVLVEGVGGWAVPLDDERTVADLAIALDLPVILVVGVRLGCLNHALLTFDAIRRSGVECAGWVANCLDHTCLNAEENIDTLRARFKIPPLAVLPPLASPDFDRLSSCFEGAVWPTVIGSRK